MKKEIKVKELAEEIADMEEHLINKDCIGILHKGKIISTKEELRKSLSKTIINDLFELVDNIAKEREEKKLRERYTPTPREIKEDFKELVGEVKRASEADPEDDFLKDILDCIKKGGF